TAGVTSGFPAGGLPRHIAAGPDGNLWFTDLGTNQIGRITTAGVVTEFPVGSGGLEDIAAGCDGNLWFTDQSPGSVARITTSGTVTAFTTGITPGSLPNRITAGPSQNMWFTESNDPGRIATVGACGTTPTSAPLVAHFTG